MFVRFQSPAPNGRGTYPGVFGLVNSLAEQGLLSDEEEAFRRENNAWYEANFTDPATVDPDVYRRDVNPAAAAWFKASATRLIERVPGYLAILAVHDVECVRLESADPGRIVYEDDDQVVVVPHVAGQGVHQGRGGVRRRVSGRMVADERNGWSWVPM
ncbi:hypothetical protein [Nonomuraea sp. NPDC001831]|uniref:hypothetical protein n=1 Tax=Nonomuraea sp. NPDC001831 TaxID=3364340 RepID=UPI003675CEDB